MKLKKEVNLGKKVYLIVFAAKELLYKIVILKTQKHNFNIHNLKTYIEKDINKFSELLTETSFSEEEIDKAKYMLCVAADEAIVNCYSSTKSDDLKEYKSLVNTYYRDELGGERFFSILDEIDMLEKSNLPILTLGRYILSMGFQGKYLLAENGQDSLISLKNKIFFNTNQKIEHLMHELDIQDHYKHLKKININIVKNYLYAVFFIAIIVNIVIYYKFAIQKYKLDYFINLL